MVSQTPPQDTPFGLQPNVAAGLAYLVGWISGLVMLLGGGTNRFVKWAACQSIVFFGGLTILRVVLGMLFAGMGYSMYALFGMLFWILNVITLIGWLWTMILAFQGKEVRIPVVAEWTQSIFKTQLQ